MKITVLDKISFTVGDIDLTSLNNLGEVEYYDVLTPEEIKKVCYNSQVIVCNKTLFTKDLIACLPNLKFIAITATGYNNVDLAFAKERGIMVANVPNYSTVDVAQHVFAFILNYSNRVSEYDLSVKQGDWIKSKTFCYFDKPLVELDGKTLGIIGYGSVGRLVYEKAKALCSNIIINDPYIELDAADVILNNFVDLDYLLENADIITIHARGSNVILDREKLEKIKSTTYVINTSRSKLIDNKALLELLKENKIMGAAIDVFEHEPDIPEDYLKLDNITLTNHRGGDTLESYSESPKMMLENLKNYFNKKIVKFWINRHEF